MMSPGITTAEAGIILRETATPDHLEVRYETWSPDEIGTEAKYW